MIEARPGETVTAVVTNAPVGLAGILTIRVLTLPGGAVAIAETTAGIVETAAGIYVKAIVAPAEGDYLIVWRNPGTDPDTEVGEELRVEGAPAAIVIEPQAAVYATPPDLRAELAVDEDELGDEAAERLLREAEDRVDRLLGLYTPIEATGRKLDPTVLTTNGARAVNRATVLLAAAEHTDPGSLAPPQGSSVSGPDFAISGMSSPKAATVILRAVNLLDDARLRRLALRSRA